MATTRYITGDTAGVVTLVARAVDPDGNIINEQFTITVNPSQITNALGNLPPSFTPATRQAPPPIFGCTDPSAINYNSNANADDGSCQYQTSGGSVGNDTFF